MDGSSKRLETLILDDWSLWRRQRLVVTNLVEIDMPNEHAAAQRLEPKGTQTQARERIVEAPEVHLKRLFGGPSGMESVKSPTIVRAYLLKQSGAKDRPYNFREIRQYKVRKGPVTVARDTSARLASILLATNSYLWPDRLYDRPKPFLTPYVVRFEFVGVTNTTDVLMAFESSSIAVHANGSLVDRYSSDKIAFELLSLVRTVFVADRELGKLSQEYEERKRLLDMPYPR